MDEAFNLHCRGTRYRPDFIDMQLPSEHNPFKAHFLQLQHTGGVVNSHLGRGMEGDLREKFADEAADSHILDDHPVRPHSGKSRKDIYKMGQFLLLDKSIEGYINFAAEGMGIRRYLLHLSQGEIFRLGPGGKFIQSGVDRIGTFLHGGEKGLQRTCGSEEFRFSFS